MDMWVNLRKLSTGESESCSGIYYTTEVYLINIPWLLFLVGGVVNFYAIRAHSIGLVRSFSELFKWKRYTCITMLSICVLKLLVFFVHPEYWGEKFSQCESFLIVFGIAKFFESLTWLGCIKLMTY